MALPSPCLGRVCWVLGILTAPSICGSAFTTSSSSLLDRRHRDCPIDLWLCLHTISSSSLLNPWHRDCPIDLWLCLHHLFIESVGSLASSLPHRPVALPSPSLLRVCWMLGILTASSICGSAITISSSSLLDLRYPHCPIDLWLCLHHVLVESGGSSAS